MGSVGPVRSPSQGGVKPSALNRADGLKSVDQAAPGRRLDVQGLRAVAVLMVVLFHTGLPIPGGFVGVDVFFVISGFVITAMLDREWVSTGRIAFGSFYLRRFKRLTPALALMVALTIVMSSLLLSPLGTQQVAAKTGVGALLLVANLVIAQSTGGYFDAPAAANPLLHTWSLSVEEQFYLVFPLLLVAAWSRAGSRRARERRAWWTIGLAACLSFGLAVLGSLGTQLPSATWLIGFYSPATRAWEFAVGALVALSMRRVDGQVARWLGRSMALAGGVALAAALWLITDATPFPGVWTLLPVAGTLLLLIAGTDSTNPVTRLLASRAMVKIGDWSYSIYLWHWPLIVCASALWPGKPAALVGAALVSVAPAYASFRWVEQPIRSRQFASRGALVGAVAAVTIPPLVLSGGLGFAARNGFWSSTVIRYDEAFNSFHAGQVAGCMSGSWKKPEKCTWNATAAGKPIYLVGDSNADQFSEGIIAAARTLARPVTELSEAGCMFMDVRAFSPEIAASENQRCDVFRSGALQYLQQARPGLVIISNHDEWWTSSTYFVGLSAETVTADPQAKLAILRAGLAATIRQLQRAGHHVMLVQTVPMWRDVDAWDPQMWPLVTILRTPDVCRQEMPVERALRRQGDVRAVLSDVAADTGTDVFDPWTQLCPDGRCATEESGLIRYRDGGHISVQQSEALASEYQKRLRAVG